MIRPATPPPPLPPDAPEPGGDLELLAVLCEQPTLLTTEADRLLARGRQTRRTGDEPACEGGAAA